MFLEYDTYLKMGGNLDKDTFIKFERQATTLIRSQAGGQTGNRIDELSVVPEAVKHCVFDLIEFSVANPIGKRIKSESQNLGGQSESKSYEALNDEQIQGQKEDIIYNSFFGNGIGNLLYRGASI